MPCGPLHQTLENTPPTMNKSVICLLVLLSCTAMLLAFPSKETVETLQEVAKDSRLQLLHSRVKRQHQFTYLNHKPAGCAPGFYWSSLNNGVFCCVGSPTRCCSYSDTNNCVTY